MLSAPSAPDYGDVPTPAPKRTQTLLATLALVGATAIWGSTFLVTKQSLPEMSPASFLVWRFGLAAIALLVARPRQLVALTRAELHRGLLLGVFLGSGFLLQTIGLLDTDAGVSGFLTGAAVVLTPLVAARWFKERVGGAGWIAVGVSTAGIALLMLRSATVTPGAVLTVAGAACFALHISALSRWATPVNAIGLTTSSVSVAAALCAVVAFAEGGLEPPPTATTWWSVIYLALAATCCGFVVQAWAQSMLTATTAAIVMTTEPLFAAVLAVTGGEETLGIAGWAGGVLVVASMFIAEFGPRRCCDALSPRIECC